MADYPGIEILDSQPAYWSTQRGLEVMENYLQKYPEIDAVWTGDDDVLKGALQATVSLVAEISSTSLAVPGRRISSR